MKMSFRFATGWSQDISNVFLQDVYVCVGFLNGKIYNGAFAGAQAWNQIKTEKGDLGGGLKKGNSVLQVYKRSARAPSHAASIAFPLCANYLICAVPNLQCYTSVSLLGHDLPSFLPSCLPSFLPGLSFSRQNPKKKQNTEKKTKK